MEETGIFTLMEETGIFTLMEETGKLYLVFCNALFPKWREVNVGRTQGTHLPSKAWRLYFHGMTKAGHV